jgi:PGF-pre-PGF domain-containing protein
MDLKIIILFILSLSLLTPFVSGGEVPPSDIPIYYWGYVTINNAPASDNTIVRVEVNDVQVASTTIPTGSGTSGSGYYHVYVPSNYSNQTAIFKVNGFAVESITLGELGSANRLDLSLIETPTQETQNAPSIPSGSSETFVFSESDKLGIQEIEIEVKATVSNASVTVKETSKPLGAIEAVSSEIGEVYKYLEITKTNIEDEDINKVRIKFKVPKSWVENKGINVSTIVLKRYSDNVWTSLPTTELSEDESYHYFESESPSLSVFAITGEKLMICSPEEKRCLDNELQKCSGNGRSWNTIETCEYGCDSETLSCKSKPVEGVCSPGERRCSGNILEECTSDRMTWETLEVCEHSCVNKQCVKPPKIPVLWIPIVIVTIVAIIAVATYYKKRS